MSDRPYIGVITWMFGWHRGSWCCLMCLARTVLKHWLRGGKWNGEEELEMDKKKKREEEACMHHPKLTNGAICLSVLTPASFVVNSSQCRGTWLFAFILCHKIFFCPSVFISTQNRSTEIWACFWECWDMVEYNQQTALSNFPNSYWFSKPEPRDFPASMASCIKGLIIFWDWIFRFFLMDERN